MIPIYATSVPRKGLDKRASGSIMGRAIRTMLVSQGSSLPRILRLSEESEITNATAELFQSGHDDRDRVRRTGD